MRADRGAVLINALVLVVVIAAIAAALMTRAESARRRGADAQIAGQLSLYLDGGQGLAPRLLQDQADGGAVHPDQSWATEKFDYDIDRGVVSVRLHDLQRGINVNWLVNGDDDVRAVFADLFNQLGVPGSLALAIADFVQPGGPDAMDTYLSRSPPERPRGGAIAVLPQLRAVAGMTDEYYRRLEPHLAALPTEARVNLNTASPQVRRAMLAAFPPELVSDTLADLDEAPMDSLSPMRNRLIEILGTEDVDDYPFERIGFSSDWFGARLTARLDGQTRRREVVLQRFFEPAPGFRVIHRWAEHD